MMIMIINVSSHNKSIFLSRNPVFIITKLVGTVSPIFLDFLTPYHFIYEVIESWRGWELVQGGRQMLTEIISTNYIILTG